ncbi:VWA domain-containing protein [bacterium]|nr:VWA domain-containing protein [bacterium]
MIRWGEPLYFLLLLLPLLLLLAEWRHRGAMKRARQRFADAGLWDRLAPGRSPLLRRMKRVLFITALALLAVGLANPRIGTRWEEVTREGIDIYLLVDVSRSMDVQDIRPTRLAKTRYELIRFLEGLKGDRVGIVPFAGTAYPLMPLTLDYAAAGMFINLLDTDLIPNQGTAIGEAIETALQSFSKPEDESTARNRAMVLISDGEDHEGDALSAARRAAEQGVTIFTVGMAQAKGDPIPKLDASGQQVGWLTDENDRPVTSRLNEDLLRDIATTTGGSYYRASQGGQEFRSIYRTLFGMDRDELETRRITGFEDRFQPLLGAALLLLAMEAGLPAGRRRQS